MSKVLSTYCFCGGFQRLRCWWCRWVTLYLSLSCSLVNTLSWKCCRRKQPHPAPHHSCLFSPSQWQVFCLRHIYIITCWTVLGNWCHRKTTWQSSCPFSVTSVSSWILPCTCRNRKGREAGKHSYLWGSRRGQECSWFIPVEAIWGAVASHSLSHLPLHSYLAYMAFRCDLSRQCSTSEASLYLCLLVT